METNQSTNESKVDMGVEKFNLSSVKFDLSKPQIERLMEAAEGYERLGGKDVADAIRLVAIASKRLAMTVVNDEKYEISA